MANQVEDSLSQAANWLSGMWGQAQDYLIEREKRKAVEANSMTSTGGTAASGTWTNPNDAAAVAAVMGSGGNTQNLMLFLALAGVAISLLTFIRGRG